MDTTIKKATTTTTTKPKQPKQSKFFAPRPCNKTEEHLNAQHRSHSSISQLASCLVRFERAEVLVDWSIRHTGRRSNKHQRQEDTCKTLVGSETYILGYIHVDAKNTIPNAKCRMPNAKCQNAKMPNAKCRMPKERKPWKAREKPSFPNHEQRNPKAEKLTDKKKSNKFGHNKCTGLSIYNDKTFTCCDVICVF